MNGVHGVVRMELAAEPENVRVARDAVRRFLEVEGLSEERIYDVLLAVSEACTNVVVHAYAGGTRGLLWVEVGRDESAITVTVRDRGQGIAPRVDSPGIGLGLPVIMTLAEHVAITPFGGGGTEVRMTFAAAVDEAA